MKNFTTTWDKTNIEENYPGITSPLTYSFIQNAYSHVYQNFLNLIGVPFKTINSKLIIFENMLGYIQGQVYYNIDNWYELVKLLPGYKYNKGFFENMLNPVINKKEEPKQKFSFQSVWKNRKLIYKFSKSIIFIKPIYRQFENQFKINYQLFQKTNITQLDNFELISFFKKLENKFFSTWGYSIINDFRVMIYYGILTKFIKKHFPNNPHQILKLIYGINDKPKSLKPLLKLIKITHFIQSNQAYLLLFHLSPKDIYLRLNQTKYIALNQEIKQYLNLYGERAFNELKLENENFKEKPESLITLLKHYSTYSKKDLNNIYQKINFQKSKDLIPFAKKLNLINRLLFNYLTKNTQQSIYKREDYRLKRAKVFHIAKTFFQEIANRLVLSDNLDKKSDISYLYTEEIYNYLRYHRLKDNFKTLIINRKKLLQGYENRLLSRRVQTYGLPNQELQKNISVPVKKKKYQAKPSSPGIAQAFVIVMPTLDLTADIKGKILVTSSTDPGWTILFPLLKGIIIEKGGTLSHASIVARELEIPCLIMPNATNTLKTNDMIKLDAIKGTVTLI